MFLSESNKKSASRVFTDSRALSACEVWSKFESQKLWVVKG